MNQDRKYMRVRLADNENYVCPLDVVGRQLEVSDADKDECVEADVVGRYSGSLEIIN